MDAAYLPSAVIFSSVPATLLITGVATSAREYVLVIGAGFWQPVIPQGLSFKPKSDFTLVSHTVPEEVFTATLFPGSLHSSCSLLPNASANHSVAPRCLNNYGQGFSFNIYSPFCSGTGSFPNSPPASPV